MKKCSKCQINKSLQSFHKNKATKDGYNLWCKECKKNYYGDNQTEILVKRKEFHQNNKEKLKHKQYTLGTRYSNYKSTAKIRKLEFSLTKEDFDQLTKESCIYCGGFTFEKDNIKYCGVDRIDNNIGYRYSNCVSCCGTCNTAKNNMNLDEFKNWIGKVYEKVNNGRN